MKILVKVNPNAKKNEIKKLDYNNNYRNSDIVTTNPKTHHNNCDLSFEISTTATPKDGEANKSIIEILSKHLRIGKTKFTCISGLKSKIKVFEVLN